MDTDSKDFSRTAEAAYVRSEVVDSAAQPGFRGASVAVFRFERLLIAFLLLGVTSACLTALLLVQREVDMWLSVTVGCIVTVILATTVLCWLHKQGRTQQLWSWAACLVVMLYVWNAIFIASSSIDNISSVFWLIALFIGIGIVPWEVRWLIGVSSFSIFCSGIIINVHNLGLSWILLYVATVLFSMTYSIMVNRRIVERYFFQCFSVLLASGDNREQIIHGFIESMLDSMEISFVLRNDGTEHWALYYNGQQFNVLFESQPYDFSQTLDIYKRDGISIAICNRLLLPVVLSDKRFGSVSAIAGIVVKVDEPSQLATDALIDSQRCDPSIEFFLGLSPIYLKVYRTWVKTLIAAVVQMMSLRISYLNNKQLRAEEWKYFQASRKEWDYELSSLVHDANNSVQDLVMLSDAIVEDCNAQSADITDADAPQVEFVSTIMIRAQRIGSVARAISTAASDRKRKHEMGMLEDLKPRERFCLKDIVELAVSFASLKAERKRINIQLATLPESSLMVALSAKEHLATILRDMLDNAIKVSKPGGLVSVASYEKNEWAIVEIIDSGPGMPQGKVKTIMEGVPLKRSVSEISDTLAQGFPQWRRVIDAAQGSLTLTSSGAGLGSMLIVALPVYIETSATKSSNMRWALMVDDKLSLTDFYARIATALGLTPFVASSVQEAKVLLTERGCPTLVVTDLQLNDEDGLDLVREVRERFGSDVPILVVSGQDDEDIEKRVIEAGADSFAAKPIRRHVLFERIQQML